MSEPLEEVFVPYEVTLDPPVSGIETITVTREDDGYYVFSAAGQSGLTALKGDPADPATDIAAAIEAWSAPTTPVVPFSVRAWRLRSVAKLQGIDAAVTAAIDNLEEPYKTAAREAFNDSDIERNHPLTEAVYQAAGLSSGQVDQLFIDAAQIA